MNYIIIKQLKKDKDFVSIEGAALNIIKESGGFCEKRELKEEIKSEKKDSFLNKLKK